MRSIRCWFVALAGLLFIQSPSLAQSPKLFDAYQLLQQNAVADSSQPIELRDGKLVEKLSIQYLRTFVEAHRKLAEVSNVNATLAIVANKRPLAMAHYGRGMIIFSTSMIELLGKDVHMMASVMAHEYAHLSLQHGLKRILNIPDAVRRGMAVANQMASQTGDVNAALASGQVTVGLLFASHSREQEKEADRVGTELMAKAKYDPTGTVRAIQTILSLSGRRETGYFDSHPGIEERLANAAPAVARQQLESTAVTLLEQGNLTRLSELVDRWLVTDPDSARAWYYKGLSLRASKKADALPAFANAVRHDPASSDSRMALCVELYRADRHRDSLLCAEHLHLNKERDEFIAATFKHPVYIGMTPGRIITAEDAAIIGLALNRPALVPARRPTQ
jgi:Zn-dependent protease with chaperone function